MNKLMISALLAATLAAAAACAASPPPEQHPVKDAVIKSKILGSYAVDPNVSVLKLDVNVQNGEVWLGGIAGTSTERDLAVEIAKGTEGVREVHSQIALKEVKEKKQAPADQPGRTPGVVIDDTALTAKVKAKLIANGNTPGGRISVTTRNTVVTLTGTVDTAAQKDLAGRLAENTEHVSKVQNDIKVATH